MNPELFVVSAETPDLHERIRVAVANIPVSETHVEASFLGRPIRTRSRLKSLHQLLNDIVRYGSKAESRIDLVVFPEVCIPHGWGNILVSWARKHQIGAIVGLEHRVDGDNFAINEILTALPYRVQNNKECMPIYRRKALYSPDEIFILKNNHLKIPEEDRTAFPTSRQHLYQWRGASFAVYNCYELTCIEQRGIFMGRVDFIVCSQFNRDIGYFSNIVESASRDLHCYIIQANDSKYGDSRVVSPSRTEMMNPLRIKGGDNLTFLTMEINLKALRDHQRKCYGLQKDSAQFKPTPPGMKLQHVEGRINLGNRVSPGDRFTKPRSGLI